VCVAVAAAVADPPDLPTARFAGILCNTLEMIQKRVQRISEKIMLKPKDGTG
jgi:hypothetical protein